MFRRFSLVLFLLGSGVFVRATTFLELGSTYLGDGWFRYQLSVMNDPFFTEADITQFAPTFPDQIDHVGPSDLDYSETNGWTFTSGYPARPYTRTFFVRSSDTSWRLSTNTYNSCIVAFSLLCADFNPAAVSSGVISANIVGYATLPCLVPCSPAETDDSPTNFTFVLKLLPDVAIDHLVQTNGTVSGVDFNWDYENTFVLQASSDFNRWTNVAYLWSDPPETTWTTNTPLNDYGQFFRIALIAFGHATNLPPLSSQASSLAVKASAVSRVTSNGRVTGCKAVDGKLVVTLDVQAGQSYQVRALDSHQVVQQAQNIIAQGTSAAAIFNAATLPSPVFFQVVPTP